MRYFNWYNQCPYLTQCNCFNCPVVQKPYERFGRIPDDDMKEEIENEDMQRDEANTEDTRTQSDVERVIGIVLQSLSNEINQIVGLGMNRNEINYFIREMVDYLDKNYNKYQSALLMNDITSAAEDIKTKYYWIFNIMRIFGVPFELQMRILYNTVRTAFQNLRPTATPTAQGQMPR